GVLGCGRGAWWVDLHRYVGVVVFATLLCFGPGERGARFRDAGVADSVYPIRADARALPFAAEFFDAIVGIDSFVYYGTDDLYANYLAAFVRPGATIAIAGAGLTREIDGPTPEHLRSWWEPSMACLHSAAWWQRHWQRSGVLDVERADTMPGGWRRWLDWQLEVAPDNTTEIQALEQDGGSYLGYVRVIARRADRPLDPHITTVDTTYHPQPLLRS
ncbi:SAM-dependent methyltransferase, partial [Nocardia asiatica]|uniref:SAM-dependent methyltransferase n=1 Tax=Nocardia asiatica TaxID=209252 RepID=UPI002455B9FD